MSYRVWPVLKHERRESECEHRESECKRGENECETLASEYKHGRILYVGRVSERVRVASASISLVSVCTRARNIS